MPISHASLRWPNFDDLRGVDELVVAFSDIEMGAGGVLDDFPQSEWLGELMLDYCRGRFAELPVTLVLNGDTFDFLKTSVDGAWPTHIDSGIALGKLRRIAAAHPLFFRAASEFVRHPRAKRQIVFVIGNHDAELCLHEVQAEIRRLCGCVDGERILFPGLWYERGDLRLEHGCQADPLFTFDASALTVEHEGRTLVNLPWGSVAMLEAGIPLSPWLYHHDRLKPREELFELMPDLKRLLLGAFWRYWTRDYWQHYFSAQDPLRRLSWTMLREVAYRFAAGEMDVRLDNTYRQLLRADPQIRVCIVGHSHEAGWFSWGRKKLLQTGCFRNEFALAGQGYAQQLLPKVYAEVYMRDARVVRSHLVEVDAPEPPAGYVPESIFGVTEELRKLLEQRDLASDAERTERELRETEEAKAAGSESQPWSHRSEFVRTLQRALAPSDGRKDRKPPPTQEE